MVPNPLEVLKSRTKKSRLFVKTNFSFGFDVVIFGEEEIFGQMQTFTIPFPNLLDNKHRS